MFTVKQVLAEIHVILNDSVSPLQINDFELFEWLRNNLEELSFINSRLFSERRIIFMTEGTYQYLPEDCNGLINLLHNIDCDDGSIISPIRAADIKQFELKMPYWRTVKQSELVINYMANSNPKMFEVYPPQKGNKTTAVEGEFSLSPAHKIEFESTINLSQIYKKYLTYAVASDYLSKDTADTENIALSQKYKKMSIDLLKSTAGSQ